MSVNSIVLYHSRGIKLRYSLFCLFIRCNGVISCSKTSVCRCNVHSLIKNFAELFQRTTTAPLYFSLIQATAAELQLSRVFVVAPVRFTTKTQHFRTHEFLSEKARLSPFMFFCACHNRFGGRNFSLQQQRNYRYNQLTAPALLLLSFQCA